MARKALGSSSLSDDVVASIVAEVRLRRGVVRRALPKVSPSLRPALDEALRAAGLEVTPSAVRLPARAQLVALLEDGAAVDEKGLVRRLVCVTGAEAKALVARLVREECVHRVERPSGTALALPSEPTVDADRAARLAEDLEHAFKWIRQVTRPSRRPRAALLERDVAELVARLGAGTSRPARAGSTARQPAGTVASLLDRVTRTAVQLAGRHGGLAPVPSLVRALDAPLASVHAALLEGYARGWFELQPESSMGRLGADELALCLPGPEGTHLSWVRPLQAAHSSLASPAPLAKDASP